MIRRLRSRLRQPVTLNLADGSLPNHLREVWPTLSSGEKFVFQTADASHEACAVITAQGWLLNDIERRGNQHVFHLQKPAHSRLNPCEIDWRSERLHWQAASASTAHSALQNSEATVGKRRCHLIGIGIAKSGTSSVAALFSRYRSAHEFEATDALERLANRQESLDTAWLQARDVRGGLLECDSSQLHLWYLAEIVRTFPEARFVLTLREPAAWLASLTDHRLARGLMPEWAALEARRFGPPCEDVDGPERLLAHYGRPTLDGMLGFWALHHQMVLETVPPERLLILRVEDMARQVPRIADFARVSAGSLTPAAAHQNTARARFHLTERLPSGLLESKISTHCTELWQRMIVMSV